MLSQLFLNNEERPYYVHDPIPHESGGFPILLVGIGTVPCYV